MMRLSKTPKTEEESLRADESPEAAKRRSILAETFPALGDTPLFRPEAVREHTRGRAMEGDLVRISPRWANAVYWFLAASFVFVTTMGLLGHVREYATGPAVVRVAGQREVTAATGGVVDVVEVQTGDSVRAGQILARFESRGEQSQVDKLQIDFDHELIRMLRDPPDSAARTGVARARAELDLATARLGQRVLRAPADGTAFDVRVRPGQFVNAGEPVASILQSRRQHELVAMLPGRYGPLLAPGQILRLRITGYVHAEVDVTIRDVGDGVVGPAEVRHFLGPVMADAVPVTQPVILVHATLPATTFVSDGRQHAWCNGLQGTAEVCVGDERILFSALPWTKALWEKWGD